MRPVPFQSDSKPLLPFRSKPLTANARELVAAGKREGKGEGFYRAAKEEIWAIERSGTAVEPTREDRERWVEHPDERVQIAMLKNPLVFDDAEVVGVHADLAIRLYERAREDALAEGVHWTPLLDALSSSHLWPDKFISKKEFVLNGEQKMLGVAIETPAQVMEPLSEWFSAQHDARYLREMKGFGSERLFGLALRHVGSLSDEVLEAIAQKPLVWKRIDSNPAFDATVMERLARRAVAALQKHKGSKEAESVVNAMEALRLRGVAIPSFFLEALVSHLQELPSRGKNRTLFMRDASLKFLAFADQLPRERVREVYDLIRERTEYQQSYLHLLSLGPHSGPELWSWIMKDFSRGEIRGILSRHPEARWHPDVRPRLLRSKHLDILIPLLEDARRAEFVSIFARITISSVATAARELARFSEEQLSYLSKEAFAPFLNSRDSEIRLLALRSVGRWSALRGTPAEEQSGAEERGEKNERTPLNSGRRR